MKFKLTDLFVILEVAGRNEDGTFIRIVDNNEVYTTEEEALAHATPSAYVCTLKEALSQYDADVLQPRWN